MNLIENLKWRYATKKFNDRKISADDLDKIIETINLSASSTGLQPYRLFVLENSILRAQMAEGSFNGQISESSHLLVFAAFEKVTSEQIDSYLNRVADERNLPIEALSDFKAALVNGVLSRTDEFNFGWASRQAYIALGTALIAAADLKIDSTPMEGFDPQKFDDLLNLRNQGLRSVVALALGYRDEEDIFAGFKKVRLPKDEFVTMLG